MPAATIEVRDCLESDMTAITGIYGHHVRHGTASFETIAPTPDDMRKRWLDIMAKGLPWLVAISGRIVTGYAYAGAYRPRAAYRHTVENSIYMRHDLAGLGIGKRLLTTLIGECENRGARQMIAVVGDSANTASIRLHERCGFARVGILRSVGFKHGRWLDSVFLQRALGPGDQTSPEPA